MKVAFKFINDQRLELTTEQLERTDIIDLNEKQAHLILGQRGFQVELVELDRTNKRATMIYNGEIYFVEIQEEVEQLVESLGLNVIKNKAVGEVAAPMPGKVLDIMVKKGQTVEEGTPLIILEAMKMENIIKAEGTGMVTEVYTEKGATVDKGVKLLKISQE
jgi:biotin carboxyl carrier protein